MSTSLLLLIDAHALIHRAFHALPPLTVSRTGEMTNAVFGFANMLFKVVNETQPTHWAAAFDSPGPTFRHRRYEEYKAQRPAAPPELVSQFRRVRELCSALGIPTFETEGYEADDLIGALCRQAEDEDIETLIVTGDNDVLQLVTPQVKVYTSRGHFADTIVYDEEMVRQRYSLSPGDLADMKGLQGDPSDNIPGVPGIGQKTAARLLQEFGSIDGIYQNIAAVSRPKLRETLLAHEAQARLSHELATIDVNAPATLDLEASRRRAYDREQVMAIFRELEFHSLMKRLPPAPTDAAAAFAIEETPPPKDSYRTISTLGELEALLKRILPASSLVIDTETTSQIAMLADLVGISLSIEPDEAFYIPLGHFFGAAEAPDREAVFERLRPVLKDSAITKVAHNAKYDMMVLSRCGLEWQGPIFDTMVAAHLLNEKALGLKGLAFNRLHVDMTPITDLIGTGKKQITMAQVPIADATAYACADADITGKLRAIFEVELKERDLWRLFSEVEMPLVYVLARMEQTGVALDVALLRRLSKDMEGQMGALERAIYEAVGHAFNINSPSQLSSVLFEEQGLPPEGRTKTGYSTAAGVLERLRGVHPVIALILDYRQLSKLKSTYLDALVGLVNPTTGRVHTSYNQTGTSTGRFSSSDPNLQNIPIRTELGREVRRAFFAKGDGIGPWHFLSADYSQVDLRVLAHFSQDQRLLDAFRHDADIHTATAAEVFGASPDEVTPDMRRVAKTVNFGVIYGMSEYGLARGTDLSRKEAASFIDAYFQRYPGVRSYLDATKRLAAERGYVETLLGRRRYIPEMASPNHQVRQAGERMAINMPVQGTAADIIKVAMVRLHRAMEEQGLRSRMILQVHDELVFEVPDAELDAMKALARKIMSEAIQLSIPLKVDLKAGPNWADME